MTKNVNEDFCLREIPFLVDRSYIAQILVNTNIIATTPKAI